MEKIAIPIENGKLSSHFGHCPQFAIIEINNNKVISIKEVNSPVHQPGLLPKWLAEFGVNHIIAAGIGQKAITLFNQNNIGVSVGAEIKSAKELTEDYLNNALSIGVNACDH